MFVAGQRSLAPNQFPAFWGQWTTAASLPNVAGSGTHFPTLQNGDQAWVVDVAGLFVCSNSTLGSASWQPFTGGSSQLEDSEISIDTFDPGPSSPRRWNAAVEAAVAYSAANGAFALGFGSATYVFTERIDLTSRLTMLGSGATILSFVTIGNSGIIIRLAAQGSRISTMALNGPHPFLPGTDVGITVNSTLCRLEYLALNNWAGQGVAILGNTPGPTNANGTIGLACTFNLCGHGGADTGNPNPDGAGVFLQGGDANGGVFIGWSFFDCRKGCWDYSFLGNAWFGCTAEGCNNRFDVPTPNLIVGCGFQTLDPNTRSTFVGCYTEGDSAGNVNYPSTIYGGFFVNAGTALLLGSLGAVGEMPANNYYVDPTTQEPWRLRSAIGGSVVGGGLSVGVSHSGTGVDVYLPQTLRYNHANAPGWWGFNYAGIDGADAFRFKHSAFWVPRDIQLGGSGIRFAMVASLAAALASGPSDGGAWAVGDRLFIAPPVAGQPSSYACVSAGPPAVFKIETTLEA